MFSMSYSSFLGVCFRQNFSECLLCHFTEKGSLLSIVNSVCVCVCMLSLSVLPNSLQCHGL